MGFLKRFTGKKDSRSLELKQQSTSMAQRRYKQLTQGDVDHFMEHGWIKLSNCFSREQSDQIQANIWARLGISPTDKTTWTPEWTNMPSHHTFPADEFAPKAWAAICDLVGGEDRLAEWNRTWNDGLIVNLGSPEGAGKDVPGNKLERWHVDGDFFVHFLDSPEQGLLVIPLFTDIHPGGGGTMICPPSIPRLAQHLYNHPEGVSPRMTPRANNPHMEPDAEQGLDFYNDIARSLPENSFLEATGEVGDVYLLHPLMMHSASNNKLRQLRIITNPPISLHTPFQFDREDSRQFSIVERKTLAALGKANLKGWKITAPRDKIVPERLKKQAAMKEQELQRLQELEGKKTTSLGSTDRSPGIVAT